MNKNKLSSLRGNIIKYRSTLNLPQNISFGFEIEYENIVKDTMSFLLEEEKFYDKNLVGWKSMIEADISEYNNLGEEINGEITSPILKDELKTWKSLRKILTILKNNGAIITNKCGGHINIGAQILGNNVEYWRNFLLLWILYEKEIYKFSSGDYKKVRSPRTCIIPTAKNLAKNMNKIIREYYPKEIINYLNPICYNLLDKKHDLSLKKICSHKFKKDNVIEFRLPNGTLCEEVWQNYVNFFCKFLLSCRKELDIDKTMYMIRNNKHDIIELADYVFDNDIDKQNFLIQSLKLNKVYNKKLQKHITYYKV